MVTLLTCESSGGVRRRCDGTCHSAKHGACVCICGGYYHGAGNRPGGVDAAVRETWTGETWTGLFVDGRQMVGDGVLKTSKFLQAKMAEAAGG